MESMQFAMVMASRAVIFHCPRVVFVHLQDFSSHCLFGIFKCNNLCKWILTFNFLIKKVYYHFVTIVMHDMQASWFPLVLFSHSMYLILGLFFSLFFESLIGHWNTFFSKGWSHNCLDSWMLVVLCCISCVFHIFLVWTTIALNKSFCAFFTIVCHLVIAF